MTNQQIFCNIPWYEAHIYWDGSFGVCAQEDHKLFSDDLVPVYNIRNMSLMEWHNSQPAQDMRLEMFGDKPLSTCSQCYSENKVYNTSRRHRSNLKSVIFTRTAFKESFEQSPGYDDFKYSQDNQGVTNTAPIDLHIDLGNYCNLACKMCWAKASSTIATQRVKWGYEEDRKYLGSDWTKDPLVWAKFLNELLDIPKLKNIHFMGGETLITSRFEEFVDFLIEHKRFDLSFSFTTNGTVFKPSLLEKFKLFAGVGIEVSIETASQHNNYIRQGTDTELVLENIKRYQEYANNTSIILTMRPAISALSIGNYYTLLEYCLEHKLLIRSLQVNDPVFLSVKILPREIRKQYLSKYTKMLEQFDDIDSSGDLNQSSPHNYRYVIKLQIIQAINLLNSDDQLDLLSEFVAHCKQWDQVYKFNAIEFYPELTQVFTQYGY
jgi:sulfatase maturation enzyme AslB (radical SAM superfamily)